MYIVNNLVIESCLGLGLSLDLGLEPRPLPHLVLCGQLGLGNFRNWNLVLLRPETLVSRSQDYFWAP